MWVLFHVVFSWLVIIALALGGLIVANTLTGVTAYIGAMAVTCWSILCVFCAALPDMKKVVAAVKAL